MSTVQNPLSSSLKYFRRRPQSPFGQTSPVNSLNVYKSSANASMASPYLNTESTIEKFKNTFSLSSQIPICSQQKTIVRTLKSKPVMSTSGIKPLLPTKHSIFQKRTLNLEKITQLSQKESIIFNQVKNVAPVRNQVNNSDPIMNTEAIQLTRMRTNKLKKLSTMRKAQFSESFIASEVGEELLVPKPEIVKRKKLKHRVWRWVAAGGDQVY